ncbi:MAG: mercury(II) reductase [Chloroflexi bacterium]|nr:mercury(II) reductase [Chloroflexota bacterium]
MERFDLIIIGGGGAGFAAAARASELGAKAVLINAGLPWGGTCVNVGCVPSKMLLEVGSDYHHCLHTRFQASKSIQPPSVDFAAAFREKDEIVASLRESNYLRVIADLGITATEGAAKFITPQGVDVQGQRLEADRFVIATGSRPRLLPFRGIERVHYLTHREALSLPRLPKSIVVVGGGPVGLEFAQMFARLGARVTVLERENQILPLTEGEVAEELRRVLEEEGIDIHVGVDIQEVREEGNVKIVEASVDMRPISVRAEELLMATGVTPNSDHMGLEAAGVEIDSRGFIEVNDQMRTSAPHIWAAGDVVGKLQLETVAAKEGYIAAGNALEGTKKTIDYNSVPRAVFTDPQVAAVGLTEDEFMGRYKVCLCRTVRIGQIPKARIVNETRGLVKMVVDPETLVIVGVHMVAPLAADLIHEAALAVKFKLTVDDIIDTVHVFPTMSESIKLVAQSFRRDITRMSCCVE